MKKVARIVKGGLGNMVTWWRHPITNAVSEGLNSEIQSIRSAARGFHSSASYRIWILSSSAESFTSNQRSFTQIDEEPFSVRTRQRKSASSSARAPCPHLAQGQNHGSLPASRSVISTGAAGQASSPTIWCGPRKSKTARSAQPLPNSFTAMWSSAVSGSSRLRHSSATGRYGR